MRIMVFFDLPVGTKQQKRAYTIFRRFLLKDGYDMLQFSIYSRLCNNHETTQKHIRRLKKSLPSKGSIRAIVITNKQFDKMLLLVGEQTNQEQINCPSNNLIVI